jgi:hypothetical protein
MSVGGSSGKSGGSTTQVSKTEPWNEQIPYLTSVFEQARQQYGVPTTYYPEATYAQPASETARAWALQAQRATMGSPLTAAASSLVARTLGGGFLSAGNPGFRAAVDRAANAIRPNFDAQFAAQGRYGSGAHARALSGALAETAGDLAYRDYAQERQNQVAAIGMAPQLAAQDYDDLTRLAEVGRRREEFAQAQIDDQIARFDAAQMEPWERLARYAELIQGNYGSSTASTASNRNRNSNMSFSMKLLPF